MNKPNVIYINCDDLGYGDLGCYGSSINDTLAIDSLAQTGVRFTSFYASSPVCSPSRASLMTGCYPPRVGVTRVLFPGDPDGLNPCEYTLGNLFKDNGYNTMIIGKWHCGDQPEFLPDRFGFDDYYGLPYSNDMGRQAGVGRDGKKRADIFPPLPLISGANVIEEQPELAALTERYTERAMDFIRQGIDSPARGLSSVEIKFNANSSLYSAGTVNFFKSILYFFLKLTLIILLELALFQNDPVAALYRERIVQYIIKRYLSVCVHKRDIFRHKPLDTASDEMDYSPRLILAKFSAGPQFQKDSCRRRQLLL